MLRRNISQVLGLGLLAAFAAAPNAISQSQSVSGQPLRVALNGYDPVAYFTMGMPTPGKPEYEAEFERTRYWFAGPDHLQLFKAAPEKYAPQYSGSCAGGMARGVKTEADPMNWLIVNDKLFVFSGAAGPGDMRTDTAGMISRGQSNWSTLKDSPYK